MMICVIHNYIFVNVRGEGVTDEKGEAITETFTLFNGNPDYLLRN